MSEIVNKTKISISVWPPAAKGVKIRLRKAHVMRDSYLNELLKSEIENLAEEVGFRTPDEAKRLIKRRFQDLKPEPMTLVLDRSLAERIDDVLAEKNISRTVFINRVLFFLLADRRVLEQLEVDYGYRYKTSVEPSLEQAWLHLYDPFWKLCASNEDEFYRLVFPKDPIAGNWPSLFGLNCAISAERWKEMNEREALLEDLPDLFGSRDRAETKAIVAAVRARIDAIRARES